MYRWDALRLLVASHNTQRFIVSFLWSQKVIYWIAMLFDLVLHEDRVQGLEFTSHLIRGDIANKL